MLLSHIISVMILTDWISEHLLDFLIVNVNVATFPPTQYILAAPHGFLCVAGPHVVVPKSPPVVCWPAIGPWQSAIGVAANHKPQHNWRGFGRYYMGTSNTQGPL